MDAESALIIAMIAIIAFAVLLFGIVLNPANSNSGANSAKQISTGTPPSSGTPGVTSPNQPSLYTTIPSTTGTSTKPKTTTNTASGNGQAASASTTNASTNTTANPQTNTTNPSSPIAVTLVANRTLISADQGVSFTNVTAGDHPPYTYSYTVNSSTFSEFGNMFYFSNAGDYIVTITARDSEGNKASDSQLIQVAPSLSVTLNANITSIDVYQVVTFSNSTAGGTGDYNYTYSSNRSGVGWAGNRAAFNTAGKYNITLTAIDRTGEVARSSVHITVAAPNVTKNSTSTGNSLLPMGGPKGPWNLVFSDNFSGASLNTSKWNYCYIDGYCYNIDQGGEWKDQEYAVPQNCVVGQNGLDLEATTGNATDPYFSCIINSHDKFDFTYGYIEAKVMMPGGNDSWPAVWTLPSTGGWPPEMDVTEEIGGGNYPAWYYHYEYNGTEHNAGEAYYVPNATTKWYVYGLDWEPGNVTAYINGVKIGSYTGPNVTNKSMYLLMDLALASFNATPQVPENFRVAYIRVWQHNVNYTR